MYFTQEPEHITALRETLRKFVTRNMPPERVREWDRKSMFSKPLFASLAEIGVCGLTVEEEYGGLGRDLVSAIAVIDELSQHGLSLAGPYVHCAFYAGINISENGSAEQKRELLPRIARGDLMFAYGLSEPEVGGDLASVTTTGRVSEDGRTITIRGTKRWCTAVQDCEYIYCLIRTGAPEDRRNNLTFVLIPTNSAGITVTNIEHTGLRYADTTDTIFDDVVVPIENVVGGPEMINKGWQMLSSEALNVERLEITAMALGVTTAAVRDAWRYAQERRQFGTVIAGHQSVRHALSDAQTKLQACRHMLYHAAWLAQTNQPCGTETAMAKLFVADTGFDIVATCQRIMGAYGLAEEYSMERHMRDIMCMPIVGGSSNMQRNNIAGFMGLARK